ncbi:hypothetical protein BD626DRAFT_569437 [Schizophyllum amplum]|uniref:Uncharacterized protein n=1 Tax=Schizophyllum amplum TaxID=97359 RepID=A0A550CDJ2_9AGAR|nr:hypothetical protein BD626DRAFT_569437 [Auriculariopsis ampla]
MADTIPPQTPSYILLRSSSLPEDFADYLNEDSVFLPHGSEDIRDDEPRRKYAFPKLDSRSRDCIRHYDGAVFPKLNFSSPRSGSPRDISPDLVFDEQASGPNKPYELELVLRKWYVMDRSREMWCFGRAGHLLDIFDILLTRDLSRAHIVDFNPYAPRTDSLMFSYEELDALHRVHTNAEDTGNPSTPPPIPQFKYVDSPAHPFARSNAPAHQHNMVPLEALSLSSGRDIAEFAEIETFKLRQGTALVAIPRAVRSMAMRDLMTKYNGGVKAANAESGRVDAGQSVRVAYLVAQAQVEKDALSLKRKRVEDELDALRAAKRRSRSPQKAGWGRQGNEAPNAYRSLHVAFSVEAAHCHGANTIAFATHDPISRPPAYPRSPSGRLSTQARAPVSLAAASPGSLSRFAFGSRAPSSPAQRTVKHTKATLSSVISYTCLYIGCPGIFRSVVACSRVVYTLCQ